MSYVCPAGFAIIDNAADKDCKHDPNDEAVPPEPAPGPGSDGDDGIYSYGYDDESSSFKDFFDENFPYDLSYDLSDDYEWDSDAVASSGDGRRMLRSPVGRGAGTTYKFVSWWGTSSSVEEALCSVETCCREV
ncbi:unnamed protein product [Sphacelaria rigidula]